MTKSVKRNNAFNKVFNKLKKREADVLSFSKGRHDSEEWANLVCKYPELAETIDAKMFNSFGWHECVRLMGTYPQFAAIFDWQKLDRFDWVDLLEEFPQFADKCDWGKLSGDD